MVVICLSLNPGLGTQLWRQWHVYEPTVLTQTVELSHRCFPELHSSTSGDTKKGVRLCPSLMRFLSSLCPLTFQLVLPPSQEVMPSPRIKNSTSLSSGRCEYI